MIRFILIAAVAGIFLSSCRSTRKIQTAIAKKDSIPVATLAMSHADSMNYIKEVYRNMDSARIEFSTFSAKVNVDYQGMDGKKYDVNANLRMYRDSAIWISITAVFGIEGLRALITKDSVKILNKQDKVYTARSVAYLREITKLPLDLTSLQDILVANPVFIDSNIISYVKTGSSVSLVSLGEFFKHLLTLNERYQVEASKLDDADISRSRTCNLLYTGYEEKDGLYFSTKRRITVAEKTNLDIKLDFKSYSFNETLSFPFSVPRNYKSE